MGKDWDKFKEGKLSDRWQKAGKPSMEKFDGHNDWHSKPRPRMINDLQSLNNFQNFSYEWAKECLRVLKHGGFLLAFSGTRTYHRMVCGIEDAGFEIRDTISWLYGSGFPKSHNIGKAVDKLEGNERKVIGESNNHISNNNSNVTGNNTYHSYGNDKTLTKGSSVWEGWGTAVKPSHEPIVIAQKPLNTVPSLLYQTKCQLNLLVKNVEEISKSNQVEQKKDMSNSVQKNVEQKNNTQENSKEQMGISQSELKEDIDLNTLSLWKNYLEEISKEMNKSITLMEREMITDLKILNSLLGQVIQENIIHQQKSQANGLTANALLVENNLKSVLIKSRLLNITSVQDNVISKEKNLNLSPNCSPIVVARKPLSEKSVALNVLKWGTGGINIDDCRIFCGDEHMRGNVGAKVEETDWKNNSGLGKPFKATDSPLGVFLLILFLMKKQVRCWMSKVVLQIKVIGLRLRFLVLEILVMVRRSILV